MSSTHHIPFRQQKYKDRYGRMLEKCAKRRDLREGIINEHPRVNQTSVFKCFGIYPHAWRCDINASWVLRQQYRRGLIFHIELIFVFFHFADELICIVGLAVFPRFARWRGLHLTQPPTPGKRDYTHVPPLIHYRLLACLTTYVERHKKKPAEPAASSRGVLSPARTSATAYK